MSDRITLHPKTATALSELGMGNFSTVETPERMAWVSLVLRRLKDEWHVFPRGKWATINEIDRQLEHAAIHKAEGCTVIQGLTEDGA